MKLIKKVKKHYKYNWLYTRYSVELAFLIWMLIWTILMDFII